MSNRESFASLPHGINKKLKCETKNKMMSVIGVIPFCSRIIIIIASKQFL